MPNTGRAKDAHPTPTPPTMSPEPSRCENPCPRRYPSCVRSSLDHGHLPLVRRYCPNWSCSAGGGGNEIGGWVADRGRKCGPRRQREGNVPDGGRWRCEGQGEGTLPASHFRHCGSCSLRSCMVPDDHQEQSERSKHWCGVCVCLRRRSTKTNRTQQALRVVGDERGPSPSVLFCVWSYVVLSTVFCTTKATEWRG